jgi:hypothetical protein
MKTSDIVKILLKATALGIVSTTSIVGTVGICSSISNAFTSIPKDDATCLDEYEALRRLNSKEVLWSLLGFIPGFLFGALYFLSKQPGLCVPQASEYDTIEDNNDKNSCSKEVLEFFKMLVSIDTPFEVLCKAIVAGLSLVGIMYGQVSILASDLNRDAYGSGDCPDFFKADIHTNLIVCLVILVAVSGPILAAGCWSTCTSKKDTAQTPARLENGTRSAGSDLSVVKQPLVEDDQTLRLL